MKKSIRIGRVPVDPHAPEGVDSLRAPNGRTP